MTRSRKNHKKNPIAVLIIVLLVIGEILLRLYWVAHYAVDNQIWRTGVPWPLWGTNWLTSSGSEFVMAAFRLLWLLVSIAVLIGLLRVRTWSWVVLTVWTGISLSVGILHYFYRADYPFMPEDYAVMAADMILVFTLNQSEVQRIFGIRRDDVEHPG